MRVFRITFVIVNNNDRAIIFIKLEIYTGLYILRGIRIVHSTFSIKKMTSAFIQITYRLRFFFALSLPTSLFNYVFCISISNALIF